MLTTQQLIAFQYDGFWACMDTFKDKQVLDELYSRGGAPWELWKGNGRGAPRDGNAVTANR